LDNDEPKEHNIGLNKEKRHQWDQGAPLKSGHFARNFTKSIKFWAFVVETAKHDDLMERKNDVRRSLSFGGDVCVAPQMSSALRKGVRFVQTERRDLALQGKATRSETAKERAI